MRVSGPHAARGVERCEASAQLAVKQSCVIESWFAGHDGSRGTHCYGERVDQAWRLERNRSQGDV
jgi:hypothetical protein